MMSFIKLNCVLFFITYATFVKNVSTETKFKHGKNAIKLQHHDGSIKSHEIFVDAETDDNDWIVIQRRINNETNFNRSWIEYKSGFGDLERNFWMGNDVLSAMTSHQPAILRVDLTDCNRQQTFQIYNGFSVLPEKYSYRVQISGLSSAGNAGDSLLMTDDRTLSDYSINGMSFSTFDKDNDNFCGSCSQMLGGGGFWYNKCSGANLNGIYYNNCQYASPVMNGIDWFTWNSGREPYSLWKVEMKISWQQYLPSTLFQSSRSTPPPTTTSTPQTTTPNCYFDPGNWQCQQQCAYYPWQPWCPTTTSTQPPTTSNCNEDPWNPQCQQQCDMGCNWCNWCTTTPTSILATTSINCDQQPWIWQCQQQCEMGCLWCDWCITSSTSSTPQTTTPNCYYDPENWQCQQQCTYYPWQPWCSTTMPTTSTTSANCYYEPWIWDCQQQCNVGCGSCGWCTSTYYFEMVKNTVAPGQSVMKNAKKRKPFALRNETRTAKSKLLETILKNNLPK